MQRLSASALAAAASGSTPLRSSSFASCRRWAMRCCHSRCSRSTAQQTMCGARRQAKPTRQQRRRQQLPRAPLRCRCRCGYACRFCCPCCLWCTSTVPRQTPAPACVASCCAPCSASWPCRRSGPMRHKRRQKRREALAPLRAARPLQQLQPPRQLASRCRSGCCTCCGHCWWAAGPLGCAWKVSPGWQLPSAGVWWCA